MEDQDSKTNEPTQKKLADSKKKGQTARSKELSNFLTLFASALFFIFLAYSDNTLFVDWFKEALSFERSELYSDKDLSIKISTSVFMAVVCILIYLFISLVSSIIGNLMIGGWVFAPKNAAPKFDKINPLKGLKKMFSMKTVIELIKSVLKLVLLGVVAYFYILSFQEEIISLTFSEIGQVIRYVIEKSAVYFLIVSMSLLIVVSIDAPYQFMDWKKNLKMSHQELKDEYKQTDGDPLVKGKIKEAQRRAASQRMMTDVPTADVIVTNPTHYAIALKFDESKHNAPIVVASGVDTIALKIKEIAIENGVEILESPELARSLFKNVDIGEPIPEALYKAVATIINFIRVMDELSLEEKSNGYGVIEEITVPEKYKYKGVKTE